jgi:hypothetical protein
MRNNETVTVKKALGQRLQKFRTEAGLSPAGLSAVSNVDHSIIKEAEKNGDLRFSDLVSLCKGMNLPVWKFAYDSFGMEEVTVLGNDKRIQPFLEILDGLIPMGEGSKQYLKKIIKLKAFDRNAFLWKSGDVCKNVYFLERGFARCSSTGRTGESYSHFVLEGGLFVDGQSFLKQRPGNTDLEILSYLGMVFYITYEEWKYLCSRDAAFRNGSKRLFDDCGRMAATCKGLSTIEMEQDRMAWLFEHFPEWVDGVPACHLAECLGVKQYAFKRFRQKNGL